jgi:hypothetical protein
MESLDLDLNPFEGDEVTPFGTPDYRYFTPVKGESAQSMLRRLHELTPELPLLVIERASNDEVVLRAGVLRTPLAKRGTTPDDLITALNHLLSKSQIDKRYVELAWHGTERAFAFTSMDESLDLLNSGELVVCDLSALMDVTAW